MTFLRMCSQRQIVVLIISLTLFTVRVSPALTLGPLPKDAPAEWVATQIGGNIFCLGISWGGPLPSDSGTVFSDFFRIDFSGVCSANGGPGGSGVFPAKRGEAHWAGAFFTDAFTNFSLAAGIPHGRFRLNDVMAYPVVRALIYDRDGMIRSVDHYQGGGPAPIYAADGIQPGKQPALWLPFDWGQLRPVHEPSLELTEKPYLKDPTRPEADNLDSIFLLRDDMTVLSGDGRLSDANGWWTAWFGRGDVLLTRLRPKAFTLPGYEPPDALSDSPPVEIDASDMNPWVAEVMTGSPDLYEPPNMTYTPPLGNNMTNDPDDDRRAQVWLQPDYEPQRAPYTLIGQAYDFPLVTGALHTAYADICPLTQDAEGNETCVPHPYFSPNAPQAGLPPEERTTPVYTFPAPAAPDEDVWLELSATWWDTRTKEEQQAQSGDAGGVEIAHPKGILTSLTPDGASHLEQRLHWRLVTPPNRPDLLETLPATIDSEPFTRLIPHARLNISEPGVYEVELSIVGDEGDQLMLDTMQVQVMGVDLDAHWPGTMAEPGPLVSDAEENDALNLIASVNDDDDNDDNIIDNDYTQSPAIIPDDDEIMTVIVRALAVNPGVGTLELFAGDGLHVFTADGTQELTLPLSVDLANPSGPLADAVNADNPQDVKFLVQATIPVERTVVELVYLQAGEEVVRDTVHLKIAQPMVKGGFTRGSVKYVNALSLSGKWVVAHAFHENRQVSVLVPDADNVFDTMKYKRDIDPGYTVGYRLDLGTSLSWLVAGWNAILQHLDIPISLYTANQVLQWLSNASGIPVQELKTRYFMTDPNRPITEPGSYTVQFGYADVAKPPVERTMHIVNMGMMWAAFRVIGDGEICDPWAGQVCDPYTQEVPLELIPDDDGRDVFRTLGGMRLHVTPVNLIPMVADTLGPAVSDWNWSAFPNTGAFSFPLEIWTRLRAALDARQVPQVVSDELERRIKEQNFQTKADLDAAITPIFDKGYGITTEVIQQLKPFFKNANFPAYYWGKDNKTVCTVNDGLCVLRDQFYPDQDAFLHALKTAKVPDDPERYAIWGIRFTRRLIEDPQSPLKSDPTIVPDILTRLSSAGTRLICDGEGADACLRGAKGDGYNFRKVQPDQNGNEVFFEFEQALAKALKAPRCPKKSQDAGGVCCADDHCQTWIVCGNDDACKQGVRTVIQNHADLLVTKDNQGILTPTKFATTIFDEANLQRYKDEVMSLVLQHGATTGEFFDSYETTRPDPQSPEQRIPVEPLKAEALSGQRASGQPLEIPDVYWQGKPRTDLDMTLRVALTVQDDAGRRWTIPSDRIIVSRELELKNPPMKGDDVKMLQAMLRSIGQSQEAGRPGYRGTVEIDPINGFGTGTNLAVNRLRYHDNLGSKSDIDNNNPTSMDGILLTKLGEHWRDYLEAFDAYPTFPFIRPPKAQNDPLFNQYDLMFQNTYNTIWMEKGAVELAVYYTDNIANQIQNCNTPETCHEARKTLLGAWVKQEAESGHWGYKQNVENTPFSIVVGGWDEMGSMGFSQIQSQHKYGVTESQHQLLNNVNLYHPSGAIKGFAIFGNEKGIGGGGGFKYAFEHAQSQYQRTYLYSQHACYPRIAHIGNAYTDSIMDLFSKGVMSHLSGGGTFLPKNVDCFSANSDSERAKTCPWPELLHHVMPPDANTPTSWSTIIRRGINYVLSIKHRAGIPFQSWTWTAQRIISTTVTGTCQIVAHANDIQVVEAGEPVTEINQILISPGPDGVLDTNLTEADLHQAGARIEEFPFTYGEEDWWYDARNELGSAPNHKKQGIAWATQFVQHARTR